MSAPNARRGGQNAKVAMRGTATLAEVGRESRARSFKGN
jgi:hypothetical protein